MDDKTNSMTRREWLKVSGAWLPVTLAAPALPGLAGDDTASGGLLSRVLGRTGARLSVLTLGAGHYRSGNGIDRDRVEQIVNRARELGVTSIDTAPNYDESESYLGEALKSQRDRFFLATKSEENNYEGSWKNLRASLKRLQTDHIDLVYIHNFGDESRFSDIKEVLGPKGTLGALVEAKKQGVIRSIGASGHFYPSRFLALLEREEIDVLMNPINFVSRHTYNFEEKIFEPARKKNVGLIAMKVLGGIYGKVCRMPQEHYDTAIRYALEIPGIASLNIGLCSVSELEKAVRAIKASKPFTPEERLQVQEQGKKLAQSWGVSFGPPTT